MASPLHVLKHEHRIIEKALRALEGVCLRLETGETIPPEVLTNLIDFIRGFADYYHHGKEETYLFPALQQQGIPWERGALGAIHHQHEVERQLMDDLEQAVEAFREEGATAKQLFVESAYRYSGMMTRHMRQEDAILFRLADEILEEEEKELLDRNFQQAAAELGAESIERYEKIASALEKDWAL
jgi:hemerythrin-like domain-containing protein